MTDISTQLVTAGRTHEGFGSVNPPIYRASTILFEDFESFMQAYYGRVPLGYGRQGNPTTLALADAINNLLGTEHTILTSSGLSSITIPMLALLQQGDHVLVADSVYGPTRVFCDNVLAKMGITTTYYDPMITPEALETMIDSNTKLVFLEAPGSLTFEMQDISGICAMAKARKCITMMDFTWATPLYFNAARLQVDIATQAVTKYVAGHSDVVMGAISCNQPYAKVIGKAAAALGNYVTGDEAALALRGLRTMKLRLEHQQQHVMQVIDFLKQQQEVKEVLYPPLPEDKGHAHWKRDLGGGAALFAIVLREDIDKAKVKAFCDALTLFGMGFSWGGYESLMVPFKPAEIRTATATKWQKDTWCIRFHIGLEDVQDLTDDLAKGFEQLRAI